VSVESKIDVAANLPAKCLMQQLLEGVRYLHEHHGIHRDLKLSNLLLTRDGILKIGWSFALVPFLDHRLIFSRLADFGLARRITNPNKPMTPKVVTLWYRAPEVLFGDKTYSTAIDTWSTGCIMGEFLLHRPLLPGTTEMQQVRLIADLIGKPNTSVWPGFDRLPLARSMDLGKNS
jgi:cyclin-dependent kinase 10